MAVEHADELMVAHLDGRMRAAQPAGAAPESFLEIPDVQDESGINSHYSRELVLECINAALASHGQAPASRKPKADSVDYVTEWAVTLWKGRERIRKELRASHGQAPAQAAPAAMHSDLRARCVEVLARRETGTLPGEALRTLAREKYGDRYDALQRAERDTETEALNLAAAAPPAQPAPAPLSDDVSQKTWALLDELEKLRGANRDEEDWDTLNKRDDELRAALAAQGGK